MSIEKAENKQWVEGLEEIVLLQLMFVVGKALDIHSRNMQSAFEKSTHTISQEVSIVRLGSIRDTYEGLRTSKPELPRFGKILIDTAWVMDAPDDGNKVDNFSLRWRAMIKQYKGRYLKTI